MEASIPYNPISLRIRHRIRPVFSKGSFLHERMSRVKNVIHPQGAKKEVIDDISENEVLNLQPGEWVQVRSLDEISSTLDDKGKYKGLYFMPEMERYCGDRFKVFKKVEIIKLESTGEVRKLRSPSVFLEGVYCNG